MNSNIINKKNSVYWNEVCGTHAAKVWNIKNHNQNSLKKFDKFYFAFYPYINNYVPYKEMISKKVLEIGPGYGSVSNNLMSVKDIDFTCLDIAKGPLEIIKKRKSFIKNTNTKILNANILQNNFDDNTFDFVVAIGCLHHTGNFQESINECYRILKQNGTLVGMVYSSFSYRRWRENFMDTIKFFFNNKNTIIEGSDYQKGLYDIDSSGKSPPATEFVSKTSLKNICKNFSSVSSSYENIMVTHPWDLYSIITREKLHRTIIPKIFGIDLYFTAKK